MKNLRKLLAVVLVVAMAFSFAATASAAYADEASIEYKTAVGVLSGVGAINGKTPDTFDPTGSITRAEAAKLVCFTILGSIANVLPTVPSSFKDVANSFWAVKYIEYCVGAGIINGKSPDTFDPQGPVTGIELAKMMLCAAGYGKMNEYVGSSWAFNIMIDASNNNVFAGNSSADYSAPATREEAALYVYNAMMNIVKVNYNTITGYAPVTGSPTIGSALYKLTAAPVVGIVTGNAATGAAKTQVAVVTPDTDGTILTLAPAAAMEFDTTLSDVGKVFNIYKNSATGKVYFTEAVSKSVTVAAAITTAANYTAAFGAVTAVSGEAINGTANYALVNEAAGTLPGFNGTSTAAAGVYQIYAGEVVSFMAQSVSTIQKVTAIGTTAGAETITFTSTAALGNNATSDVVNEYTGIAVGDYVQVTIAGGEYNVVKLTTVKGTISEVGLSNAYIVCGGVKYAKSTLTDTTALGFAVPTVAADFAKEYTLYLDASNNVFASAAPVTASTSSVVFVFNAPYDLTGAYGTVTKNYQCVDNTGAEVIYNTGANVDAQVTADGFYKVTVTAGVADFAAYTATDLAEPSAAVTVDKTDVINKANYYYASDVEFIFISGSGATLKVEKVTGLAAADGNALTTTNAVLYFNQTTNVNKLVTKVLVDGAYTAPSATGADVIYIPLNAPIVGANANGNLYNVYINGVKTLVTATNTNLTAVDDMFVSWTKTAAGVYTFATNAVAGTSIDSAVTFNAIFNSYMGTVNAAGATVIDLATAPTGTPYASVAAMEAVTGTKSFTIDYATNASGVITTIYITAITDAAITIGTQPSGLAAQVSTAAATAPLTVAATVTNSGTLTYQWYVNDTNDTVTPTAVSGATSASYTIPANTYSGAGTHYYYCVVSSTGATSVTSTIVSVVYTS